MTEEDLLKENPRLASWKQRVDSSIQSYECKKCFISIGLPPEEQNKGWEDYINWCHEQLDEVHEGEDVQPLPRFKDWQDAQPDSDGHEEFSRLDCDLCGGGPGERYGAIALQDGGDYYILAICPHCVNYVANGELPEDL